MIGAAFFLHVLGGLMQWLYPEASRSLPAFRTAFLLSAVIMASVTVLYSFSRDERGREQGEGLDA